MLFLENSLSWLLGIEHQIVIENKVKVEINFAFLFLFEMK